MSRRSAAGPAGEWDADRYHALGKPQLRWGAAVLARLPLVGDETVLDAGCGSGRLTALLLERLPRGRVIAVDASAAMLERAAAHLGGDPRVEFVQADLTRLRRDAPVDAVFSNAVFHHVPDHAALFTALHAALRPGGRLAAQCGGGPNLARVIGHVRSAAREDPRLAALRDGTARWCFADPAPTAHRLAHAGFAVGRTALRPSPVPFPGPAEFRAYLEAITLRAHLAELPGPETRAALLDAVTARAASDPEPWTLDHWRLDLDAVRPAAD